VANQVSVIKAAYRTSNGIAYHCAIEDFIASRKYKELTGEVDLIITSPPYPLVSPKAYGNRVGEDYKYWLSGIMRDLKSLLKPRGSLVIEIGNAWEKGSPAMSTLPLETLIHIKNEADLHVCQQFIWNNPNKLPGPATWVNIKRLRVKDAYTHIWWYSNTTNPRADNTKVLNPYKDGMKKLLERQDYNRGVRPSGHSIGDGFLRENKGSIPSNVLTFPNSLETKEYRTWCKENGISQHPARMPEKIVEFFVKFLTTKGALVLDPFGGSNTTGRVAQTLERKWIYIEKNHEYVMGSKGRFKTKFS
jgi:site-specific DNA-methyltransferase (cytosine-N4-specific)